MKKYIFLLICLGLIKLNNISFFTQDINVCNIVSNIAKNLYDDSTLVSNEKIGVIDFALENNSLMVEPLGDDVILPISGIITKVYKNYITITDSNNEYDVYNIKCDYKLYQYYKSGSILGSSNKYVIIGNNLKEIATGYILNYEAI